MGSPIKNREEVMTEESDDTGAITERELLDNALNKGIKHIWIEKSADGRFILKVKLTWKTGEYYLRENRHDRYKGWKSVDRLISHFEGKHVIPASIEIKNLH